MSEVQNAVGRPRLVPATDASRQRLEDALTALDGSALPFASRFIQDDRARQQYRQSIREAIAEIRADVASEQLTPEQGALRARQLRDEIMNLTRERSSDLGRAVAERLKPQSPTFEELIARYAERLFQQTPEALTETQRGAVMREIIAAAARDNVRVSGMLRYLGPASRGVMALSLGLAIYDVYQSPNRPKEALHQGVVLGAGMGGSYVVGAVGVSLVCGPGAPICAGVFILVGGIAFAAGADYFWHRLDATGGTR